MKYTTLTHRILTLGLTTALAAGALVLSVSPAYAAGEGDRLDFANRADDYSKLEFLGSITLPASKGSMNDSAWLQAGPITTPSGCPDNTVRSRNKIVIQDSQFPLGSHAGELNIVADTKRPETAQPGWGLDGKPIRLTADMGSNALKDTGFQSTSPGIGGLNPLPAGDFWYVITCDPAPVGNSITVRSPYFSVKLTTDGLGAWSLPGGGPVGEDKATTTAFTAASSRLDGRVDFTATVTAEGGAVNGGTVDFVNAADQTVLATGTVLAGQATATSAAAIDPVNGVNVQAIYRGTEGFTASDPSVAQQVFGVKPSGNSSGTGDVTVLVEQREDPAPAGSVKFTAAATADLGKAKNTKTGIEATGSIEGAVVTDTRSNKSAPWVVNGKTSKFTTTAAPVTGKLNEINASALSWTPAAKTGTTLPTGATAGTAKTTLEKDRALVSWAAGGSGGAENVSQVGASLNLAAEGDFVPGSYTAKLTLTLI